jgi:hypothetical protein
MTPRPYTDLYIAKAARHLQLKMDLEFCLRRWAGETVRAARKTGIEIRSSGH